MPRAKKNEPKNTGAKRGRPSKKQLAEQQVEQEQQVDTAVVLEEIVPTEEFGAQEQTQEDIPTEALTEEDTVQTEEFGEHEQTQEEIPATEELAGDDVVPTQEEPVPIEGAVLEEQPPVQQRTVEQNLVDDPILQGQINPPMKIEVEMRNVKPEGKVRATANLTLADCLLIRNVKLMESRAGELYASMPKYQSSQNPQIKYNHVMALTDDFKAQLNSAMTETYEQALDQQESMDNTAEQSMENAPDGGMTMNM